MEFGRNRTKSWTSVTQLYAVSGKTCHCNFIRLEARLQPNIGNTLSSVSTVFTRSAATPPKASWFGWSLEHSWVHCLEELVLVDFGRDLRSSDSGRATQIFLSGKQRSTLPISGRPNFTKFEQNTLISVPMKPFGTQFWRFPRKGSFFQKTLNV